MIKQKLKNPDRLKHCTYSNSIHSINEISYSITLNSIDLELYFVNYFNTRFINLIINILSQYNNNIYK